ncbi:MAG TPA: endonuclease VII domain-containing protein [Bacteroidia bacterium]|nr:endonuclease VII domain-containing protein [Bacteroidia bacterium]
MRHRIKSQKLKDKQIKKAAEEREKARNRVAKLKARQVRLANKALSAKQEELKELLDHSEDLICASCNINQATINESKVKIEWCSECKYQEDKCKSYGITLQDRQKMITEQDGCCAICNEPMESPRIDHCHDRGHVRGLLCGNCNTGLGFFRDRSDLMIKAAIYVQRNALKRKWYVQG